MKKLFISSFIVVTDQAIDFIEQCESEGIDYSMVMVDGGNPIFPTSTREDWLINSSGFRELPIEDILHNEESDGFADAVNELISKMEATEVYYETFNLEEDVKEIVPQLIDSVKIINTIRGDLLINHKEYLEKSNIKWKARYGNRFVEIITSSQHTVESEEFGFILMTDVKVDGNESGSGDVSTYITLAKDYDRREFFAPTTNVESFENIPLFISILEEQFGLSILNYHFRTFLEKGISNRIVFLEVDPDKDSLDVLFGKRHFEVNKYSDLVTFNKEQAFIAGGLGSWASLMIDDIKKEAAVSEQ